MTEASLIAYKGTEHLRLSHRVRIENCLKNARCPLNIRQIGGLVGLSKDAVGKRMSEVKNAKVIGTEKDNFHNITYSLYVWTDEPLNKYKLTANYRKQFRKNFRTVINKLGVKDSEKLIKAVEVFEKYGLI